jgi:hypothetical protein
MHELFLFGGSLHVTVYTKKCHDLIIFNTYTSFMYCDGIWKKEFIEIL